MSGVVSIGSRGDSQVACLPTAQSAKSVPVFRFGPARRRARGGGGTGFLCAGLGRVDGAARAVNLSSLREDTPGDRRSAR